MKDLHKSVRAILIVIVVSIGFFDFVKLNLVSWRIKRFCEINLFNDVIKEVIEWIHFSKNFQIILWLNGIVDDK
jgi:hypothetical protein